MTGEGVSITAPVVLWLVSNMMAGTCYLLIAYEMMVWTRRVPKYGTGFRALVRLFAVLLGTIGLHQLMATGFVWPSALPMALVAVDASMSLIALLTAILVISARDTICAALRSMLEHHSDWGA